MTFSDHTAMTAGRSYLGRFGSPQVPISITYSRHLFMTQYDCVK
ncbi:MULTISPECIES: hypothetical protein [Sphingobium]|uniref:Uncharacterized protein n=1 Tax=Sphingobium olei TaxID=420955 RepID=A0ABW3NWR7_9SPHN|nr:hypothetical protein [Sphingobium yanoikuyae]